MKSGLYRVFAGYGRKLSKKLGPTGHCYEVVKPGNVSNRRSVPGHIKKPSYWMTGEPEPPPHRPEIKTQDQIQKLRASCQIASQILDSLKQFIQVGVTTDNIDAMVHDLCVNTHKVYPSPLGYNGFPKSVCTSVNNVACHGIPDDRPLADGDIVNVDVTVYKDGYHGDCSRMFLVGNVDPAGQRLSSICLEALTEAVAVCRHGQDFSKIGYIIEEVAASNNFQVVPCFTGHGIGSYFHGPPDIYHIGSHCWPGRMEAGMTFTIEPVLSEGGCEVVVLEDGWTAITEDGSRTAQWEHTILINSPDLPPEILTSRG